MTPQRNAAQVAVGPRATNHPPQSMEEQIEARVRRALTLIAAGRPQGIDDLFGALGASVYSLSVLITGHRDDAGDATVATFEHIWASRGRRSGEMGSGSRWVLNVACQRARTLRTDRKTRTPHRTH